MREIRTDPIMAGDHFLLDGEEFVAEEPNGRECDSCALGKSNKCYSIPCDNVIFKRVKKETTYRPYKDTDEMIADWKERFMVVKISDFCMPLIWVQKRRLTSMITEYCNDSVSVNGMMCSMGSLLLEYTYLDGSPCGKVEE